MARILRQTTVARNGLHNAFTDLQFWQGCYWVGYRRGAGHVSMDGEAVISVSADRRRFRQAASFHVPGDNRDPKLFPVSDSRMAAYFPSWTRGVGPRELQQYISFSGNGFDWREPQPILPRNMWLWRIREHDGRFYGLIQNLQGDWDADHKPHNLDLAVSDDLTEWEIITRIGEGCGLCESDIHWHQDGRVWVLARSAVKPGGSYFCEAEPPRPPYAHWEVTEMDTMVHAPVFLPHEGDLYVAGRSSPEGEGVETFPFRGASLGIWRVTPGELEPVLRIPATGDCSYPGLIKDPEGRICLTYYSQHAYHLGVVDPPAGLEGNHHQAANDVYFAELELP